MRYMRIILWRETKKHRGRLWVGDWADVLTALQTIAGGYHLVLDVLKLYWWLFILYLFGQPLIPILFQAYVPLHFFPQSLQSSEHIFYLFSGLMLLRSLLWPPPFPAQAGSGAPLGPPASNPRGSPSQPRSPSAVTAWFPGVPSLPLRCQLYEGKDFSLPCSWLCSQHPA